MSNFTGYKTSKDYAMLWELAKTQSVVCLYEWNKSDNVRIIDKDFLEKKGKEEFVENAKEYNIEFLPPCDKAQEKVGEILEALKECVKEHDDYYSNVRVLLPLNAPCDSSIEKAKQLIKEVEG